MNKKIMTKTIFNWHPRVMNLSMKPHVSYHKQELNPNMI